MFIIEKRLYSFACTGWYNDPHLEEMKGEANFQRLGLCFLAVPVTRSGWDCAVNSHPNKGVRKSNLKPVLTRFCCKIQHDIELNNSNFYSELEGMCGTFTLGWQEPGDLSCLYSPCFQPPPGHPRKLPALADLPPPPTPRAHLLVQRSWSVEAKILFPLPHFWFIKTEHYQYCLWWGL